MYLLLWPFSFPSQFLEGLYCSAWYSGSLPVKSSKSILISSPSFYFLLHLFFWMPDFCIQLSTCHQNTHFKLNMPKTLHTHITSSQWMAVLFSQSLRPKIWLTPLLISLAHTQSINTACWLSPHNITRVPPAQPHGWAPVLSLRVTTVVC